MPRADDRADERNPADVEQPPPGVELIGTSGDHDHFIESIAWLPDGSLLATSAGGAARVWYGRSLKPWHSIDSTSAKSASVAFDRHAKLLAIGKADGVIELREVGTWRMVSQLSVPRPASTVVFSPGQDLLAVWGGPDGHAAIVRVPSGEIHCELPGAGSRIIHGAFTASGSRLATVDERGDVRMWDAETGRLLTVSGLAGIRPAAAAFIPGIQLIATGGDPAIRLWDRDSGQLIRTLEGHTGPVLQMSFTADGRLMASKGTDNTVRLWDCQTWSLVATLSEPDYGPWSLGASGVAFHPAEPLLATVGSKWLPPSSRPDDRPDANGIVHLWKIDPDLLLGAPRAASIAYASAKIVLVGESGAGKTGLGYRLAQGVFKDHASTHGQQFWLLDELSATRDDGTQCEAILWDLAGQPDYRIIHTLFLDDADVALIVFDPTRDDDPLQGVDYWLSQLGVARPAVGREVILVAARADRGAGRLSSDEITRFCAERGIRSFIVTSARTGEGIGELIGLMRTAVHWDQRPPTVTTMTFKWIKETVLGLKEGQSVILSPGELRDELTREDATRNYTNAEMLAAVGHLANHGYVALLKTSQGESRVLLKPELLNNVAASMVLEARRNPKGLGSLAEQPLLAGDFGFPELDGLSSADRNVLLDSAIALFLAHNVCFRETDPLTSRVYLVFPELINLRRPAVKHPEPTDEGVAYTVTGAVENLYASLVVLLGFTDVFTRTSQWRDQAEYVVGENQICGFRLEAEREGELEFVLYYGASVGDPIRTLFQGLFESFLARRDVAVFRIEPVSCSNGHQLNRGAIRELAAHSDYAFCMRCAERVTLPNADVPIQLTRAQAAELEVQRLTADRRARFEQALFRLKSYAVRTDAQELTCFISYAWGIHAHERWVERELATDLAKAGIAVLLDRWENAKIGASVPRFVDRVHSADRVVVVGTPLYLSKYRNDQPMGGFVLAAEGHLIGNRMIGSEQQKLTVLPILLDGTQEASLPPLLQGRVYSDFRQPEQYFAAALDLILSIYEIPPHDPISTELRQSLALPVI